jgi:flagellar biosynthesis/type III secretory pathway protein FliH
MEILTSWMQKGFEQGIEEGFKLGWEEGFKIGIEECIEEGKKLGRQQEAALIVRRLLQHLFGDLSQSQQERIQGLSTDTLEDLVVALLDFNSITDLENWLTCV